MDVQPRLLLEELKAAGASREGCRQIEAFAGGDLGDGGVDSPGRGDGGRTFATGLPTLGVPFQ